MISIIDYGLGNLASVRNALDSLKIPSVISSNTNTLKKARAIILPGVGSAEQGIANLKKRNLDKAIKNEIKKGKPILGVCLGMQLLFSFSEEGNAKCLNVIDGKVIKFKIKLKVPQIGWNQIRYQRSIPTLRRDKDQKLFKGILNQSYFYFVHSYYCEPEDKSVVLATTEYGIDFCSVLKKDNVFGVQFHPEKSGENGLRLLKNFSEIVYANNSSN